MRNAHSTHSIDGKTEGEKEEEEDGKKTAQHALRFVLFLLVPLHLSYCFCVRAPHTGMA
jgi:hypothetical protein